MVRRVRVITAEKARRNTAEYHQNVEAQLEAEAKTVCEERISPLIEEASSKGARSICFKFDECSAGVNSRVAKILEIAKFGCRFENGGRCCTISW